LTVKVSGPNAAEDEELTPWLEAIQAGEVPWTVWKLAPKSIDPETVDIPEEVVTDEQGRFEIHGVGRERYFSLVFKGETVAHERVEVATRQMEPIDRVISTPPFQDTEPVYGATFTFTAAPSRPVVGRVRDAETGEPLEGVSVESYKLAGYPYSNHRVLKTTTDQEGRFRLIGMPKADGNRLLALPNDDQPYFMREVEVPDPTGLGPATVEIELHRGVWITGRVTDKVTKQPVHARLHYLPLRSNKFAQAIPEFDEHGNTNGDQLRYQTRPDGSYRLVGLPGRAIVGADSVLRQYREGVGADRIDAPKYRDTQFFDTYRNPLNPGPKWPNVMKEIDPPADAESVRVDLQMDPGQSARIAIVGPDGQPITGVTVDGQTSGGFRETIQESTIEAINFSPGETRTIVFHHEERNLGQVARIRPEDGAAAAITVKLDPCATVTGRLLHEDGAPYTGLNVEASVRPSESFGKELPSVTTDSDGRFRYTIVPGSKYWLHAEGKGIRHYGTIEEELVVEPGETKDLGDLTLNESGTFTRKN
jgi:5-hydroxyisourate hydrolase-like protein (transthyretin family)